MLHALIETLLTHQSAILGCIGALFAAIVIKFLLYAKRLDIFGDPSLASPAAGPLRLKRGWKITGLVILVALAGWGGASYGKSDPIEATRVLGMPDLTCNHHGKSLIIFLHGWRGDREETWKRFPDLVCGDYQFRDTDVLSIGYPTYLIGSNLSMEQFGGWLADKLAANDIGRYEKIAIICHSIGGLLARQIVLEHRPELNHIGLLVELGTPHLGPYSYSALIDQKILPGGKLVGEIQADSPYLNGLEESWKHLATKPHTFCEGSPADKVVSIESAQYGCDEKHTYPALDHRGLVKPTEMGEDRYKIPTYAVKKYLE